MIHVYTVQYNIWTFYVLYKNTNKEYNGDDDGDGDDDDDDDYNRKVLNELYLL